MNIIGEITIGTHVRIPQIGAIAIVEDIRLFKDGFRLVLDGAVYYSSMQLTIEAIRAYRVERVIPNEIVIWAAPDLLDSFDYLETVAKLTKTPPEQIRGVTPCK